MSRVIRTYVFVDLETTGLPMYENNSTRITELSMVAVKREHMLDTRPGATPRIQQKLNLCFNPGRVIDDDCSRVTGLDNFLLEYEPWFNKKTFDMIDSFLSLLTPPVCFIAQNGFNFDYPILKSYLVKFKVNFTTEMLCADCYHGFYDILEKIKSDRENFFQSKEIKQKNTSINEAINIDSNIKNVDGTDIKPPMSPMSMQAANETTPKSKQVSKTPIRTTKVKRRLFPWGNGPKPKESYKLKDIYSRVLNKQAKDAHHAENDCMFALEIAVALSEQFVGWVDENHKTFADIEPMTIGVPI